MYVCMYVCMYTITNIVNKPLNALMQAYSPTAGYGINLWDPRKC